MSKWLSFGPPFCMYMLLQIRVCRGWAVGGPLPVPLMPQLRVHMHHTRGTASRQARAPHQRGILPMLGQGGGRYICRPQFRNCQLCAV